MPKENIKTHETKLLAERARIMKEIDQEDRPVNFGDDADHFEEEADEAEDLGNRLAVAHDLKIRIAEIDAALNRIRQGTYGKCERCGTEISREILDLTPESSLCQNCKRAGSHP